MKTANILLERNEQDKIRDKVSIVDENYDSFVLVEVTDEQIKELKNEGYKVLVQEDISRIQIGDSIIDTDEARYDDKGSILSHPSYSHEDDPGPGLHHYIIQFIGPIKEEWIKNIEDLGGIVGSSYPAHSYIVEMDGETRNKVIKQPYVRWIGHYDPEYRVTADTLKNIVKTPDKQKEGELPSFRTEAPRVTGSYYVSFYSRGNMKSALSQIENLGAAINTIPETRKTITVSFPDDENQLPEILKKIAMIHGVRSIEPLYIRKISNNIACQILNGSSAPLNIPLKGAGEVIAVADTGIDTGDPSNIHKDFEGRIAGIKSWPIDPSLNNEINNPNGDDGASDIDSGHGTHVTGSVLGNGTQSTGKSEAPIRGPAYEAHLFFQAIEQTVEWKNPQYEAKYGKIGLYGIPSDLTTLFNQAYSAGARIHTNSWGGGKPGAYDEFSKAVDKFTWDNKDIAILFAVGNDGMDPNRDGKIDLMSITPPSTAKNCIAVGAAENKRTKFKARYGDIWPKDFPKAPISMDKIADNPSDIAAFSSRGPCEDGRFKPDVVAPGTFILSTKSSVCTGTGWGTFDDNYFYMGGTSQATPLTAGAVALIRQYFRTNLNITPSAALIKAALIHTAARKPYRYAATPGAELWDAEQGWGHVNVKPFVEKDSKTKIKFIDAAQGLQTGQSQVYDVDVKNSSRPLKITLVWNDPAGGDYYPSLVNNLDLIVTDPQGKSCHGNVFTAPFDRTTDKINNVEVVNIKKPKPGRYNIMILASEVKKGPQDFALVYSGNLT